MNYYNEHDEYAARWLCNLIEAGHIPRGYVDNRDIQDVAPRDLDGFASCHFFAGIGVWALALRLSEWPDDRPVWTGSCPCQPFSAAGKGAGFDDERHLWPAWHHLIRQCRPASLFGEQVASSDAAPWLDLVQDDMEALDYAFGAVPFPAAGVGAPHIRDRFYWVADDQSRRRREGWRLVEERPGSGHDRTTGLMGHADEGRSRRDAGAVLRAEGGAERRVRGVADRIELAGATGLLGNAGNEGLAQRIGFRGISGISRGADPWEAAERAGVHADKLADADAQRLASPPRPGVHDAEHHAESRSSVGGTTRGFWSDADWLRCRDGKARPVEPGTFPLAHGAPSRVGRLRAYGNAIVAPQAEAFIRACMT